LAIAAAHDVRRIAAHALERQAIADGLLDTGADHHSEQGRSSILPAVQNVMDCGMGTTSDCRKHTIFR
jgi:hypothetical protein